MIFISRVIETIRAEVHFLRGEGRGWTLLAIAGGWLVILGLRYLIPALLPQIKADFGISNATAGLAITVIWITYAFMQFPAGLLADRFGERLLLIASLLCTAVGVAAISIAPEFVVFLIACGVFGVGTGFYGPSRSTAVSTLYAPNDEAAFGVVLGAGSLGAALIPLVVQPVTAQFGWQIAVGASLPLFFGGVIALRRAMPQLHAAEDSSERPVQGDLTMITTGIRRRPVVVGVGIATISLFVFQALTAFLPVYLIATKGISQQLATVLFAELFITGALFQVRIGAAANQYGERRVLVVTVLVSTLALFVLPFVQRVPALAVVILGISARFGIPSVVNAYIVGALPDAVHSSAWGLLRTGFFAVAATGSTVVGVLADAGLFDAAILGLGALTGVAALLIVALSPRRTLERPE
jgi:predicted MFS family arabinose efflux permease